MTSTELRHINILELLSSNKRMQVTELAQKLGVSLVTVRKDVTLLEEKKLLLRFQGYVELNMNTPVNCRMLDDYALKVRIVKEAAKLVKDGDTVMIESGSCCILLANELKNSGKRITIITNSTFMADFISPCNNIKLIIIGGEYQPESMAVVGVIASASLEPFYAKYFFSGTDGYRKGAGFTGDNPERCAVLRKMSQHAEKTVVITQSRKFLQTGSMTVFSLNDADIVVTDCGLDATTEGELEKHNILIMKEGI